MNGYGDAIRDLNVAMHIEESLGGKKQIERELKLIIDLYKGNSSVNQHAETDSGTFGEIYNPFCIQTYFLFRFILHEPKKFS